MAKALSPLCLKEHNNPKTYINWSTSNLLGRYPNITMSLRLDGNAKDAPRTS